MVYPTLHCLRKGALGAAGLSQLGIRLLDGLRGSQYEGIAHVPAKLGSHQKGQAKDRELAWRRRAPDKALIRETQKGPASPAVSHGTPSAGADEEARIGSPGHQRSVLKTPGKPILPAEAACDGCPATRCVIDGQRLRDDGDLACRMGVHPQKPLDILETFLSLSEGDAEEEVS